MALPPSGVAPSTHELVVIDDNTTCLDFPLPFQYLCEPCWERDQTQKGIMNKRKFKPCDHPWARIPTKNIISYKSALEWLNDERLRAMQALTEEEAAAGAGPSEAGSPDTSESIRDLDHRPEGSPGPAFRPLGDDEVVVTIAANNDDFRLKKVATAVRARPSAAAVSVAVAVVEAPSIPVPANDTSFIVSAGENEADFPGLAATPDPGLAAALEVVRGATRDDVAADEDPSLTASIASFGDDAGEHEAGVDAKVGTHGPGLAAAVDVLRGATRDFPVHEDSSLAASSFSTRAEDNADDDAGAAAPDPAVADAVDVMRGATRDFAAGEDSSLAASSFSAWAEDNADDDDDDADNDLGTVNQDPVIEDAVEVMLGATRDVTVDEDLSMAASSFSGRAKDDADNAGDAAGSVTQDPVIEDAVQVMLGATRDFAVGEDSSFAALSFIGRAKDDAADAGDAAGSVTQVSVAADTVDAILASLGREEGEAKQFTVNEKCAGEFCPSSGATAPDRPPPPTTMIHVGTTTDTAVAEFLTGPSCAPRRPRGGPQPGHDKSSLPLKKRKAWRALEASRSQRAQDPALLSRPPSPALPPAIIAARPASVATQPLKDDDQAVIPQLERCPNSRVLPPLIPNPGASREQSATPSSPAGGGRDSFTHASSNEVPHSQPCIELGLWPPEASIYDAAPRHGMDFWARLKHASHHQFTAVPARSQDADDGGSMGSLTSSLDDATFEGSDSRIQLNHPGREIWVHQNAARGLTIAMTVQDGGGGDDEDESLLTEAPTTGPSQPVKRMQARSPLAVKRSATHPARETHVSSSSSSNAPESIPIQVRCNFSGRAQFSPLTRAKRDKPTFYEVPAPKQNSNVVEERVLAAPTDDS